jgi:hypothetical protein
MAATLLFNLVQLDSSEEFGSHSNTWHNPALTRMKMHKFVDPMLLDDTPDAFVITLEDATKFKTFDDVIAKTVDVYRALALYSFPVLIVVHKTAYTATTAGLQELVGQGVIPVRFVKGDTTTTLKERFYGQLLDAIAMAHTLRYMLAKTTENPRELDVANWTCTLAQDTTLQKYVVMLKNTSTTPTIVWRLPVLDDMKDAVADEDIAGYFIRRVLPLPPQPRFENWRYIPPEVIMDDLKYPALALLRLRSNTVVVDSTSVSKSLPVEFIKAISATKAVDFASFLSLLFTSSSFGEALVTERGSISVRANFKGLPDEMNLTTAELTISTKTGLATVKDVYQLPVDKKTCCIRLLPQGRKADATKQEYIPKASQPRLYTRTFDSFNTNSALTAFLCEKPFGSKLLPWKDAQRTNVICGTFRRAVAINDLQIRSYTPVPDATAIPPPPFPTEFLKAAVAKIKKFMSHLEKKKKVAQSVSVHALFLGLKPTLTQTQVDEIKTRVTEDSAKGEEYLGNKLRVKLRKVGSDDDDDDDEEESEDESDSETEASSSSESEDDVEDMEAQLRQIDRELAETKAELNQYPKPTLVT